MHRTASPRMRGLDPTQQAVRGRASRGRRECGHADPQHSPG